MKQIQGFSIVLVVGLVALVLVAGGFFYMSKTNNATKLEEVKMMEEKAMNDGVMVDGNESAVTEVDTTMENKGVMIDKDNETMKNDVGGKIDEEEKATMKKDGVGKADDKMEMEADEVAKKDDSTMMQKSGTYTAYSASALATAQTGKTVLFFHAGWCPTCRAADADITAGAATIPAGVTILRTDYDKEVALKQKYGVTTQHTFVEVDKNGAMVQKWSGGNLAGIVAKVK